MITCPFGVSTKFEAYEKTLVGNFGKKEWRGLTLAHSSSSLLLKGKCFRRYSKPDYATMVELSEKKIDSSNTHRNPLHLVTISP